MEKFVGKMGVASGDTPESYIFAKGYHHFQTFSRELEKIHNLRTFFCRYMLHPD